MACILVCEDTVVAYTSILDKWTFGCGLTCGCMDRLPAMIANTADSLILCKDTLPINAKPSAPDMYEPAETSANKGKYLQSL